MSWYIPIYEKKTTKHVTNDYRITFVRLGQHCQFEFPGCVRHRLVWTAMKGWVTYGELAHSDKSMEFGGRKLGYQPCCFYSLSMWSWKIYSLSYLGGLLWVSKKTVQTYEVLLEQWRRKKFCYYRSNVFLWTNKLIQVSHQRFGLSLMQHYQKNCFLMCLFLEVLLICQILL